MKSYITSIHINNIFHLQDITISNLDEEHPHLILTGKNGSGKTIFLNALANLIENFKKDEALDFMLNNRFSHDNYKESNHISPYKSSLNDLECSFRSITHILYEYHKHNFIFSFYQADRKIKISEPKNPTKPEIRKKLDIRTLATDQLLNFLSDLKIQEALYRNENQIEEAEKLGAWFTDFQALMREIFRDNKLQLTFDPRSYKFYIKTNGKIFRFNEMSDGYAAIIDIVADLILKMQEDDSVTRAYEKQGIVLIDEIETHLHLELQKFIMPMLTKIFPNIQFIVTTHSPFVLSSMSNAVAYDLEHQQIVEDLTDYSYEALAEGYFGVKTDSSYAEMQLNTLKNILSKSNLTIQDKTTAQQLIKSFDAVPEVISPMLVGEYRQLKLQYANIIKTL